MRAVLIAFTAMLGCVACADRAPSSPPRPAPDMAAYDAACGKLIDDRLFPIAENTNITLSPGFSFQQLANKSTITDEQKGAVEIWVPLLKRCDIAANRYQIATIGGDATQIIMSMQSDRYGFIADLYNREIDWGQFNRLIQKSHDLQAVAVDNALARSAAQRQQAIDMLELTRPRTCRPGAWGAVTCY